MNKLSDVLFVLLSIVASVGLGTGWWLCFTAHPATTVLITAAIVVAIAAMMFARSSFCVFEVFDSIEDILDD